MFAVSVEPFFDSIDPTATPVFRASEPHGRLDRKLLDDLHDRQHVRHRAAGGQSDAVAGVGCKMSDQFAS